MGAFLVDVGAGGFTFGGSDGKGCRVGRWPSRVRDELRPEVVGTLAAQGIGITMVAGDNQRTARALAGQADIQEIRAKLRPEGTAAATNELNTAGHTAMNGDGINDAPALAAAEVGIVMGPPGRTQRSSRPTLAARLVEPVHLGTNTNSDFDMDPMRLGHTNRQMKLQNPAKRS